MKRVLIHLFTIGLTLFTLASCDNYLDTVSYTERNTSNFPASEEDAIELITGIYATLNEEFNSAPARGYLMLANLISDDQFGGGDGPGPSDNIGEDHMMYKDIEYNAPFWTICYKTISRANMALQAMDNVKDEKLRNQLKGEAYILRSFIYFELAQMWESVPLMTGIPKTVEEAQEYPTPAPAETIYAFIAASLREACEIMPADKYSSCLTGVGHVTRWVAEGLLARVYMFYTGFYSDKEGKAITALPVMDLETGELTSETITKDYVIKKVEDCINNSGHYLVPDYRLLWSYSNPVTKAQYSYLDGVDGEWYADDENPEKMFYTSCSNSSNHYNQFNLYCGPRGNVSGAIFPMLAKGYGYGHVNPQLWYDWLADEPNDIRRSASIYNIYDEADMSKYKWGDGKDMQETGFEQKKSQTYGYYDESGKAQEDFSLAYYGAGSRKKSPINFTWMRFSEILLIHSELTETTEGINKVRARAGLAPISSYSLQALQKERRYELAFEGLRWADMRRWGKAYCIAALESQQGQPIHNVGVETVNKCQGGTSFTARYQETWGFRPYPQTEIDLSNGVLTQKSGWSSVNNYTGWQ